MIGRTVYFAINIAKNAPAMFITTPYDDSSSRSILFLMISGSMLNISQNPSSGGTGIRLNVPSTRFIAIAYQIISLATSPKLNRYKIKNINPNMMKFDVGPAMAVSIHPVLTFL